MAAEFRLDPRLVFALIRAESNFDPLAKSPKNAQGLMQLIPETAERFAVRDVWDPMENLRGGMSYLRWLLSYFKGDVVLALAGYNAGEGAVDRHKGVPPYAETIAYVQRIRALYPADKHPFDPKTSLPLRAGWLAGIPPGTERLR
jgi:soluble lytic murein transglycosylase-like protein